MASEKLQKAYDDAKKSPNMKIGISVFTREDFSDGSWRKEQKKRCKSELAQLNKKIESFDRDKAADTVMSALMREQQRLERELEDDDVVTL